MEAGTKQIKVLIAKTSMDGHWRGVAVVASALRDAGMEVVYGGALTPEQIAEAAIQEDVDVIGLNIGGRYGVVEKLMGILKERRISDMLVVAGGTIPDEDCPTLQALGIAAVFPPGSNTTRIAEYIKANVRR